MLFARTNSWPSVLVKAVAGSSLRFVQPKRDAPMATANTPQAVSPNDVVLNSPCTPDIASLHIDQMVISAYRPTFGGRIRYRSQHGVPYRIHQPHLRGDQSLIRAIDREIANPRGKRR